MYFGIVLAVRLVASTCQNVHWWWPLKISTCLRMFLSHVKYVHWPGHQFTHPSLMSHVTHLIELFQSQYISIVLNASLG